MLQRQHVFMRACWHVCACWFRCGICAITCCCICGSSMFEVQVVGGYVDVFFDDLLGLPPSRHIDFHIGLVSCVVSIAKTPYWFPPNGNEGDGFLAPRDS